MSAPIETELKLLVLGLDAEQALQALRRAPSLQRRKLRQQRLVSRYFDTPDGYLQRQRCALRLRQCTTLEAPAARTRARSGGSAPASQSTADAACMGAWEQTFKTAGSAHGGLSQRGEWTAAVAAPQPEREPLRASAWDALDPSDALFERLQPCFETHSVRSTWLVARRDGTLIEVTLDAGHVQAGSAHEPLLEIELELLAGPAQALFDLADELAQRLPCLPSNLSKAERAAQLAAGVLHQPLRARRLEPLAGERLHALAQRALAETLDQLLRNLEGLLHRDAPELVHQARVGWRRWRSLLRLLRPWYGREPDAAALRPLLDALGQQRNLDVACHDTLPAWGCAWVAASRAGTSADSAASPAPAEVGSAAAGTAPDPDAPSAAAAEWQQARAALLHASAAQRERLRRSLASPASGRALLALALHLWQLGQTGVRLERRAAGQRLARWHRRLQALLHPDAANALDVETLHSARLLAKRLRYGSEALANALPARRLRQSQRWVQEATLWQERIGQARDAWQAALLLQQHQAGAAPMVAFMQGVAAAMERAALDAARASRDQNLGSGA